MRILIWGKTYPEVSSHYTETVCTGGVREDGSPIRLYPVPLRYLEGEKQYRLYDLIDVVVSKSSSDPRPESYKVRAGSILRAGNLAPDRYGWKERRAWVFKNASWQFTSVEKLKEAEETSNQSLGIIEPGTIEGIRVRTKSESERKEFEEKVAALRSQPDLFRTEYKKLSFCPFEVRLKWRCPDSCRECSNHPHDMQVLDWGLMELARKHGWDPEVARTKLDDLATSGAYEFKLFMGNFRLHPKSFGIVGLWYPKHPSQLPLL